MLHVWRFQLYQRKGLEVSVNISDDRKCTKVPVPPTKGSGMRKKRICYQYWNTFGRCKVGVSCPYDHICMNVSRNVDKLKQELKRIFGNFSD